MSSWQDIVITSQQDIEDAVEELGFLPFFSNPIRGFSIEEMTPEKYWFSSERPGPWEWKGPIAVKGKAVYGKFFHKKAGFISLKWFPDFANYRRDGYDFDSLVDEGRVPAQDQRIYELIKSRHAIETRTLKALAGYGGKEGKAGLETILARLQMETYVNIRDFIYPLDRHGNPYGWGIAEFTTPEEMLTARKVTSAYRRDPQESRQRMIRHLVKVLGPEYDDLAARLLG